jgi:hypothetical protein
MIVPLWALFERLLRGGRFASYNPREDRAGADKGQPADNQSDAQSGHFDQPKKRILGPVLFSTRSQISDATARKLGWLGPR